ncbi:MAG: cation:proton antiporter [Planctomycetota bacterium]
MHTTLLYNIVIILSLSIAILLIGHRLHIPTIFGLLMTGALAGPHGLGLVSAVREVETLAEIGVVLLLFTIGIEFSFKNLLQIKRSFLVGGSLQVLLTILAAFVIARRMGQSSGQSLFMGFLICLSSTAIVLKFLQERGEVDSPHGRTALAILIFQDVVIVPMILLTPILAGATDNLAMPLLMLLLKGAGVILLVIISANWIVPNVLYQVARTRSRELFLLSIVAMCSAFAWLTSHVGLSLALGAFLAGLIIAESEYSQHALSNILPFRDVFTSFFFISIGMLLNAEMFFRQIIPIALITLGILTFKTLLAGLAVLMLGFPFRVAILTGIALSQVGEFSFILSRIGVEHGLLSDEIYQTFLAVSILAMAATPFLMAASPALANLLMRIPLPKKLVSGLYPVAGLDRGAKEKLKDHLIIIGFGVSGRNVARTAKSAGVPYLIIEMNPDTVRREQAKGEPIYYGDAIQDAVLLHAGIQAARVIVLTVPDPVATRRITASARRLSPTVHIIARTRYLQEMKPLCDLGANEVIPEEFETSIEIFNRVLVKYLVPRDEIERLTTEMRSDSYVMLRRPSKEWASVSDLKPTLADVEISTFRIGEGSAAAGKTLAQLQLRKAHGVTLLAIRRGDQVLSNPAGDTQLSGGDVVIVLGPPAKISAAGGLFRNPSNNRHVLKEKE